MRLALELLNLLYLKEKLITIDDMGCQKDIVSKIKDKKGYFGSKRNRGN